MARYRRHHRRSFKGLGDLPVVSSLGKGVKGTDVLIGAAGAILGFGLFNYLKGVIWDPTKGKTAPEFLTKYGPLASAAVVGAGLYYGAPKVNFLRARRDGLITGLFAASVIPTLLPILKSSFPTSTWLPSSFGVLTDDRGYRGYGLLTDDQYRGLPGYADVDGLGDLAASAMGDDDDGIDALLGN